MTVSVHLVRGDDPILRDDVVDSLVEELLDGEDRSLALDDHVLADPRSRRGGDDGPRAADEDVADAESVEQPVFRHVLTALASPPLMTSRRVVVLREIGNLTADQVDALLTHVTDPLETTRLVLVAGGGRISQKLTKALKAGGAATHAPEAEQGSGKRGGPSPVAKQLSLSLHAAGLDLVPSARERVEAHLGGDAGRVPELVHLLRSTYGDGVTLDVEQVEPYLGEAGTAERYALANAIDAGDVAGALETLQRLLHATSAREARSLHPLQLFATLQYHYRDLLRLDDPAIATKEDAAAALGTKSPYAARYRLDAARALGTAGLREAYDHLARADVDLRGGSGLPPETVLEVLVARLAALARRTRPGRRR